MKIEKSEKKLVNNTIMLYIMTIAKLIFPLITLPYLTRVLSETYYGFSTYVKSCMTYMQLIVDFGFILSSVKDIVQANGDKRKIAEIIGNTYFAKFLLAIVSFVVFLIMIFSIPILRNEVLFCILSFIAVVVSVFFADFFFRGIEKMYFITVIFVVSKGVAVILTFILVKGDSDIIFIPIIDIIMNIITVVFSLLIIKKLGYKTKFTGLKNTFLLIKDSFIYFLSNFATSAFSALNTLLIGIFITDLVQVAYWGVCLTIITAIQGLYAPICNSIYPHMITKKDLGLIRRIMLLIMPIVSVGCLLCFFFAKTALLVVGGEKYIDAYILFRYLIPILFFSFPAQLYGWPTLGAIGKNKEATISTISSAVVQVVGLFLLIIFGWFTLINIALLRGITECIFMIIRIYMTYKNKRFFNKNVQKEISFCKEK